MDNNRLQQRLIEQLQRLVRQLAELDESRSEFDAETYDELRSETVTQLEEMQSSLDRLQDGTLQLRNDLALYRDAITAAISDAFRTPEVIRMFVARQPGQLRARLEQLDSEHRLHRLSEVQFQEQRLELLTALLKLGDVTEEERRIVDAGKLLLGEGDVRAAADGIDSEKLRRSVAEK